MDFDSIFRAQIETLKSEGNYRTFAELERKRGEFPRAANHKDGTVTDITVWCSNDYLIRKLRNIKNINWYYKR